MNGSQQQIGQCDYDEFEWNGRGEDEQWIECALNAKPDQGQHNQIDLSPTVKREDEQRSNQNRQFTFNKKTDSLISFILQILQQASLNDLIVSQQFFRAIDWKDNLITNREMIN